MPNWKARGAHNTTLSVTPRGVLAYVPIIECQMGTFVDLHWIERNGGSHLLLRLRRSLEDQPSENDRRGDADEAHLRPVYEVGHPRFEEFERSASAATTGGRPAQPAYVIKGETAPARAVWKEVFIRHQPSPHWRLPGQLQDCRQPFIPAVPNQLYLSPSFRVHEHSMRAFMAALGVENVAVGVHAVLRGFLAPEVRRTAPLPPVVYVFPVAPEGVFVRAGRCLRSESERGFHTWAVVDVPPHGAKRAMAKEDMAYLHDCDRDHLPEGSACEREWRLAFRRSASGDGAMEEHGVVTLSSAPCPIYPRTCVLRLAYRTVERRAAAPGSVPRRAPEREPSSEETDGMGSIWRDPALAHVMLALVQARHACEQMLDAAPSDRPMDLIRTLLDRRARNARPGTDEAKGALSDAGAPGVLVHPASDTQRRQRLPSLGELLRGLTSGCSSPSFTKAPLPSSSARTGEAYGESSAATGVPASLSDTQRQRQQRLASLLRELLNTRTDGDAHMMSRPSCKTDGAGRGDGRSAVFGGEPAFDGREVSTAARNLHPSFSSELPKPLLPSLPTRTNGDEESDSSSAVPGPGERPAPKPPAGERTVASRSPELDSYMSSWWKSVSRFVALRREWSGVARRRKEGGVLVNNTEGGSR